jgi:hypothetical protein
MSQVLFIAAEQVEGRGKEVKGNITPSFEESLKAIRFKTINELAADHFLKQEIMWTDPDFIPRYPAVAVIDARAWMGFKFIHRMRHQ